MWDVRASTTERQAYADRLADAYAEGRLDYAEFHSRHEKVFELKTHGELRGLLAGLPAPSAPAAPVVAPPPPSRRVSALALAALGVVALLALTFVAWLPTVGDYSGPFHVSEEYSEPDLDTLAPLSADQIATTLAAAEGNSLVQVTQLSLYPEGGELSGYTADGTYREFEILPSGDLEERSIEFDTYVPEPTTTLSTPEDLRGSIARAQEFGVYAWGAPEGAQPTILEVYHSNIQITFQEGSVTLNKDGTVQHSEAYS